MAYIWMPTSEKPTLNLSGNMINLDADNVQDQVCPGVIHDFLNKMGWTYNMSHPDTCEPLFQKEDKGTRQEGAEETNLTESMYFRWYEALSWEFYKMMNIGSGN